VKTPGQLLYEHKHPSHISVIPVERRHFATAADVLLVPNPNQQVPWRLLTERCRESWEKSAIGTNFFLTPEGKT